MFTLKLLGGASLEGPDGPVTGRASQRRRLATLALLAMSRRHSMSREKLLAALWPESDAERGRHLLSDTVYVINRALGGEVISGVADELRLHAARLTCDARQFEEAVERGSLDEAIRLYAGPFLDGFFVDGSEEFERWTTAERERLQALFERALEQLAAARSASGDERRAVECWRRLAAEDPYNSRVACHLARALERAGDRAGALQHAQAHVTALKRELGVAPPEELAALLHSLRPDRPETSVTTRDATAPAAPCGPERSESPAPPPATQPPLAIDHDVIRMVREVRPLPSDVIRVVREVRPVASEAAQVSPRPSVRPSVRRTTIAAVVGVLLLIGTARVFWPRSPVAVTATSLQSVAVLPFADLSPAGDHEYLSDGVAEELSTRLARVPGLKVAARTSAFTFRGTGSDARAIGRTLGVDALVEGSVRQAEGRLRVAVRLVDARNGYQIWADTWDRAGRDVLTLQDEIARSVLQALRRSATGVDTTSVAQRTIDPAAYDLYLKGRYLWHQRTRESLTRAAAVFDEAVTLAPAYAEAHSGLADAYAVLGFYDYLPPREAFPRAKAAATRALALDDRLAEAYASLGYVALYYDWSWADAERAFGRAIELNPSYTVAHQWFANYLVARGRFDDAVTAMRRAQQVDPLSLIASAALGWVHYYRRDFDAAIDQCRRTIELNPKFELAWLWGGWAHEAAGHYADARRMLETAAELSGRSAIALTALGRVHALSGDARGARAIVAELERTGSVYLPAYEMAKLHLALGERKEALAWLQRAYDQRSHSMVFLAVDPQLDPLRSDETFRSLLAATGVGR